MRDERDSRSLEVILRRAEMSARASDDRRLLLDGQVAGVLRMIALDGERETDDRLAMRDSSFTHFGL